MAAFDVAKLVGENKENFFFIHDFDQTRSHNDKRSGLAVGIGIGYGICRDEQFWFFHVENARGVAQSFAQTWQHFSLYLNVTGQVGNAEKLFESNFHKLLDKKFKAGD
ncbi:MAG: hypothetical protein ACD_39C00324G0001 [uncultured bacterium]|nr:MAG: hypothetical protein ACD_39C00324G0001 [uncultured bacterium]